MKVILFTAEWCQPCKQLKPIIRELASEYNLDYREVDVDKDGNLALQYGVMSIPCTVFLKGEEVVDMIHGVKPKIFFRKIIEGRGP